MRGGPFDCSGDGRSPDFGTRLHGGGKRVDTADRVVPRFRTRDWKGNADAGCGEGGRVLLRFLGDSRFVARDVINQNEFLLYKGVNQHWFLLHKVVNQHWFLPPRDDVVQRIREFRRVPGREKCRVARRQNPVIEGFGFSSPLLFREMNEFGMWGRWDVRSDGL